MLILLFVLKFSVSTAFAKTRNYYLCQH